MIHNEIRFSSPPSSDLIQANPKMMNRPPYFTVPITSPVFDAVDSNGQACLPVKEHLQEIIDLVAGTYGPIANYRVLAGNVIGTGGWRDLPVERQYKAVTEGAGAFIASGMMYLELTGPDAVRVLDYLTPRNIQKLAVGRAPFTIFTTHQGGVDEEALVLRLAEDRFLVSCGGGQMPSYLFEALTLFQDVTVTASDIVSFNIKGPKRKEAILALVSEADLPEVDALKPFQAAEVTSIAGDDVVVVRTVIGFEMWGQADAITDVWKQILTLPDLIVPCGWDLLDTYRMECDDIEFLLHPLDMNYATSLYDTGLDWMIDKSKTADYIGKAALTSLQDQEAPIRTAKVIGKPGASLPDIGEQIFGEDGSIVGHVTSTGYSYAAGAPMAYVHLSSQDLGASDAIPLQNWSMVTDGADLTAHS